MPSETKATPYIPLSVPHLSGNEWKYVKDCLDTAWVSTVGSYVGRFEQAMSDRMHGTGAVATVNGTAALHVALLVAGVKPDDEVIVSTLTFVAPVNAVRYIGAWPIFIDAEPSYFQMNPDGVASFLRDECELRGGEVRNRTTGRRVSAILPVHILGHPVDVDPILELARTHNLPVVEDATESLGALYKGRTVGCLGDISCFSFNGNKLITTGGGGMIVTPRSDWARRAKYLTTQAKDDELEFVHGEVGFNYRLTNVQAAIGVAQMEVLDGYIATKRRIAAAYTADLAGIPGVTPMRQAPWAESAFWLYTILVDEAKYGHDSRALLRFLEARGIQARPLWQPNHRSPAHASSLARTCPVADRLNRDALSLPCSVGLAPDDQHRVVEAIRELHEGRP